MDIRVAIADRETFDEEAYLRRYPDIARAVAAGKIASGWVHYQAHGADEGRQPNDFDEAFYLRAYPLVANDLAQGRGANPFQHYLQVGRARGYLSHPKAPRGQNPAAPASPFGGLWIDQRHAEDLIEGKLDTGVITQAQAEQLRFFNRNGYVVLPGALPKMLLSRARAELERAFNNGFDGLKFQCDALQGDDMDWQPEILTLPSTVLDLHHLSAAIRQAVFAPNVAGFLELLFESKAFATQSHGFLHGAAQDARQDSTHVPYTLPRHFVAAWAAFEDVTIGGGEMFYYPGSHRFPDLIYGGASKSAMEARRIGIKQAQLNAETRTHANLIEQRVRSAGIEKAVFSARAGDVLVRHADLVHGGRAGASDRTRKSLVTHYCPKYASPLFGEDRAMPLHEHDGHLWTTSHYDLAPGDR